MKNFIYFILVTPLICLGQVLEGCENISSALPDLALCDDDNDGIADFDLTFVKDEILSGQDPSNYNISFHVSQTDAENNTSPVAANAVYTNLSNPQAIYTRTTDTNNTCLSISSFSIIVEEYPFLEPIPDQEICHCDITSPVLFNSTNPNISADWVATYNPYLYGYLPSGTGNIDGLEICNVSVSTETITFTIDPFNVVSGCYGDSLVFSVTVFPVENCTASVTDLSLLNFSIYPNPTKDYLNIDCSSLESVSVYNILGKELIKDNSNRINVSLLSKGVYFIKVSDGINSSTKKFIKN
tara:strand:- start:148 stop:1041 length:894 start_codon:yes stop_codon:yes gene_type:complete